MILRTPKGFLRPFPMCFFFFQKEIFFSLGFFSPQLVSSNSFSAGVSVGCWGGLVVGVGVFKGEELFS